MLMITKTNPYAMFKGTAQKWVYEDVGIILESAYHHLMKDIQKIDKWTSEILKGEGNSQV